MPECESCGAEATVTLPDASHWCVECDEAAATLGLDNNFDGGKMEKEQSAEYVVRVTHSTGNSTIKSGGWTKAEAEKEAQRLASEFAPRLHFTVEPT